MSIEALKAALGHADFSMAGEDRFSVDGGDTFLSLSDLSEDQRSAYDDAIEIAKTAEVVRDVEKIANSIRFIATAGANHVKVGGWNAKVDRAVRVLGGVGTDADLRILGAEAQIRGRSVEDHAKRIVAKAEALGELNAFVEGFESTMIEKAKAGDAELVAGFILQAGQSLKGQTQETIASWVQATAGQLQTALSNA